MTCPHERYRDRHCPICELHRRGQAMIERTPFVAGSSTSHQAAQEIATSAGTLRERVLACIREHGPITDERIANLTGLNPSTARPRRIELLADGLIQASLEHGTTTSGRAAVRWEAV